MTESTEIPESTREKAEEIKNHANEQFKAGHYDVAQQLYTKAIELNPHNGVFYTNRSIAYLRTELYGYALEDAAKAIELQPLVAKGYYRRAAANMALGRFKKALKDFDLVRKIFSEIKNWETSVCRSVKRIRATRTQKKSLRNVRRLCDKKRFYARSPPRKCRS
jgi:serine/threonine-protein phosphatase 5